MDFMHDVLATVQHVRVFTLVDVCSRECVALEVAKSFSGADVARLLSDAGERVVGLPTIIQSDNGTEFTSTALDHWAYWNRVALDFSRHGKPADNSVCEALIARGILTSVADLRRKSMQCIRQHNKNCQPIQLAYSNPKYRIHTTES